MQNKKEFKVGKRTVQRWANELRSGKYNQAQEALEKDGGFCCLGVACKLFIKPEKLRLEPGPNNPGTIAGGMPEDQSNAPTWLKKISSDFTARAGTPLQNINDKGLDCYAQALIMGANLETINVNEVFSSLDAFTFDEIADLLEAVYVHKVLD